MLNSVITKYKQVIKSLIQMCFSNRSENKLLNVSYQFTDEHKTKLIN